MADLQPGDQVQWNWGSGHPSGTVAEVKEQGSISIESNKGNTIKKNADPENPAVLIERPGNDVVKRASELTKIDGSSEEEPNAGEKNEEKEQISEPQAQALTGESDVEQTNGHKETNGHSASKKEKGDDDGDDKGLIETRQDAEDKMDTSEDVKVATPEKQSAAEASVGEKRERPEDDDDNVEEPGQDAETDPIDEDSPNANKPTESAAQAEPEAKKTKLHEPTPEVQPQEDVEEAAEKDEDSEPPKKKAAKAKKEEPKPATEAEGLKISSRTRSKVHV